MATEEISEALTVLVKLGNRKKDVEVKLARNSNIQLLLDVLQFTAETKFFTTLTLSFNKRLLSENEILGDLTKAEKVTLAAEFAPYTLREVVKHVDVLRNSVGLIPETQDSLSEFGISANSKFIEMPLYPVREKETEKKESSDNKSNEKDDQLKVSDVEKTQFEKTIREVLNMTPDLNDLEETKSSVVTPCLRSLGASNQNPVPPSFRSRGHLLYLHIVTLENESFHVTATPAGFYINKSTSGKFDPTARDGCATETTLYDLIATHSKKFDDHVKALTEKLKSVDPAFYLKPSTNFLAKPWLVSLNASNAANTNRLSLSESSFVTERNFNDEFQAIKDMTYENYQSRVDSEKLIAKISHEFTEASVKGAMSIFHGDLIPMNPESSRPEQIFLKDNIFYSYVTDVNENYADKGGEEAARSASNQDLHTVRLLHKLNLKDIRYLLTTIVDFGGLRILAQTPVPGLLSAMGASTKKDEKTGEIITEDLPSDVTVSYGLDEGSQQVLRNDEFHKAMDTFSKVFHLKDREFKGTPLRFSSQSKGIVGFDKRKYILDLANTHPFDVQFYRKHYESVSEEHRYPHKQTLLRHELIEKWWINKTEDDGVNVEKAFDERMYAFDPDAFYVAEVEDMRVQEISKYLSDDVLPNVVKDYASGAITAPYDGEHLSQAFHKNGINLRYLGEFVTLVEKELEEQIQKHDAKLREVSEANADHEQWEKAYLAKIEAMIKERQEEINKLTYEGKDIPPELKENLKLDENEIRKPTKGEGVLVHRDQINCLIETAKLEMIARSSKHILRKAALNLAPSVISSLLAHFFNILLGNQYNEAPQVEILDEFYSKDTFDFTSWTRGHLLNQIRTEVLRRFRFTISIEDIERLLALPFPFIKSINKKFGAQLLNKEYFFTEEQFETHKNLQEKKLRNKLVAPIQTFSPADITLVPVIKGSDFQSVIGDDLWNQGATSLNEKQAEALALLTQSVAVKEEVNGLLNGSVAESYMALSTIYHKVGDLTEAVVFCRKASVIFERIYGVDSFEVLRCLTNLAILETSNGSPFNAALLLQRIINTIECLCVCSHPAIINAYTMIQQLAMGLQNAKLSIEILKHMSDLILKLEDGNQSLPYGYNQSRLGNLYATADQLSNSLKAIKDARDVFTRELGINDETTAQCRQWISGLENLIESKLQQKKLSQQQAASSSNEVKKNSKTSTKKDDSPNPQLADKSIDELLNFIEGAPSKSKKNKKKRQGPK
ncbi:LAMI_0F10022g1_1 [Lachancea mirantina]|uniref:LAMI_0F10022g1_1 n=1 Tax=Lachancea mirantina TaxID=1230905 RepID=A0A1G4K1I8_9SACH|nr:LAMI_0F10022g1_1 [Lachancea mirantina]